MFPNGGWRHATVQQHETHRWPHTGTVPVVVLSVAVVVVVAVALVLVDCH